MNQNNTPTAGYSTNSRIGVVIVAAGLSQRMVTGDKVFAQLLGKPLIAHTISVFEESPLVDEIILIRGEQNIEKG